MNESIYSNIVVIMQIYIDSDLNCVPVLKDQLVIENH